MSSAEVVDEDGEFGERPSRSARKRAAEYAQKLGVQLLTLREEQLLSLGLPEELLEALREARRLRGQPKRSAGCFRFIKHGHAVAVGDERCIS